MTHLEMEISQVYYSTIQNGFCLSAIITFIDDEQKSLLEGLISSLKFND